MNGLKPIYYVRQRVNGVWYVLWRIRHEKVAQKMVPMWWREDELGESIPYLYRTQSGARAAVANYGSPKDVIEFAVWDREPERRAETSA